MGGKEEPASVKRADRVGGASRAEEAARTGKVGVAGTMEAAAKKGTAVDAEGGQVGASGVGTGMDRVGAGAGAGKTTARGDLGDLLGEEGETCMAVRTGAEGAFEQVVFLDLGG